MVKPIEVSSLFQHCESAVRENALQITRELPGPVQFTASDLNETEAGSLMRITDMFVNSLSAALLNVSVARIAIDGGNILPKDATAVQSKTEASS
jgi:hypothetical protein